MGRPTEERIFVGVLRIVITVHGARTLKDRRQVVVSIRDRMRHRFNISFHEIEPGDDPTSAAVAITTAGNDQVVVRSVLDQCAGLVRDHTVASAAQVDVEVFRWHPSPEDWAARMMAEIGTPPGEGSDE